MNKNDSPGPQDLDYNNYNINLGGGNAVVAQNNPLLASVHT